MYENFFYLKEKPFHITPDTRFLFLSRKHREAMDLMTFGIKEKKGFIVLTGEVGTGKTTLCRAMLEQLPKKISTALILNPVLSEHDLLKTITTDFGLTPRDGTVKAHLDSLNGFLLGKAAEGASAAVIIDEAQNLGTRPLEMLRLLSNLETEKDKLLQIILVAQPELKEKLRLPELRQLNQRIIVRYDLRPLDRQETTAYIQNRLFVAGGGSTVQFTDEAARCVYEASSGIPRIINVVCDRSLTASFVNEKKTVDVSSVNQAIAELENDGYLRQGAQDRQDRGCLKYIPHIAASVFFAALVAGFYLAPAIIKKSAFFDAVR